MRYRILTILLVLFALAPARADEGMWLPALISERIGDMQSKGFKLTAEDIYSINQASLKDAVVLFGSGCTGELVSRRGLLLTNHHCGYSYIQRHSAVEHDYLKDGFWARNSSEELPNPGLTVRFLERMEDVTAAVLEGYDPAAMSESERAAIVKANSRKLKDAAVQDGNGLKASVEALYYGNQYFLFVFREYRDVRLVGAPPSSIGKFGGETDNWMWPRHTGDFSIFRIYAGKDNMPADYSPDNVPYVPKRFLKISTAGVGEGDFTFVYGCPGSTKEYVHSAEVDCIANISDPEKIALRTKRLEIMKKYMDRSQAVRIQYSSKYAGVANAWKKWQGEEKGLHKMKTVEVKREYEKRFAKWAVGTPYEGLTDKLAALYAERNPLYRAYEYYNETVRAIERLRIASGKPFDMKDYYQPIDEETFVALMTAFDTQLDDSYKPDYFLKQRARYRTMDAWKKAVFANEKEAKALYDALDKFYNDSLLDKLYPLSDSLQLLYRDYMRAQMEFEPKKPFYPDANLTLRVAYGHVAGYSPSDAIYYEPVSTLKGIIEKDNPDIFDYNIPQVLRDIYASGGHDAQPVCFLATNHTTGGNSGSPVLNADGNLIGINFDRVWEGTLSDLDFDPEFCRNISLDVRYILFIIKEVGHADYLLDEMEFVGAPEPVEPGISVGPWLSDTGENGFTVLWTSEVPGTAYVELEDGTKVWDTFAGRRIFRRLHSIRIDGRQRGSEVRYRICGRNIKDDTNPRDPSFAGEYASPWYAVKTLDGKAQSCRFSVFNDIHMDRKRYATLASQVDSAATDFIFLNGDIVSAGNYELDTLVRYAIQPLGNLTHGLPLQSTRGNHEGRGNNTGLIAEVFPHTDPAPFYYTFRQGPVAFIVFDAGETHEKRSKAYAGAAVFEDYLAEQIKWAEKAMREPQWRSAPVKVCLVHVPMIDHEDKSDYLLQRWLNVHMVPMLNKAGIDLMIGADLHEFMLCEPGTMGNKFPILVNDNARRLEFDYTRGGKIHVSTWNASGEKEFEREFRP